MIVVNKSGGAGAEGFLAIKEAKCDPNKTIITLSNLFTTPVAMLALDQFVLWVNADSPYESAKHYLAAVKAAGPNKFKMGGTGSKQEDQIITVAIERAAGVKFTCIPFKGGGDVAVQLVGQHIDSSVNNPIEAVAQWRAGGRRPLCVFDAQRMPHKAQVTETMSWNDIPSCKEAGIAVAYVMLRGIFMPPGVTKEQVDFYVDLVKKVRETPDWKKFMEDGAFNATFMSALLPMLALGIPGSPTPAVLLGGLLIWGLQPGLLLFVEQRDFVWGLIASMYLGNIAELVVVLTCVPLFAAILRIPFSIIAPVIKVICAIGAYTVHNAMLDIWFMLAFGVIGYVFKKLDYPLAPLVLALVLCDRAEDSFRQTMLISQGDVRIFYSNWLVGGITGLALVLLFWSLLSQVIARQRGKY